MKPIARSVVLGICIVGALMVSPPVAVGQATPYVANGVVVEGSPIPDEMEPVTGHADVRKGSALDATPQAANDPVSTAESAQDEPRELPPEIVDLELSTEAPAQEPQIIAPGTCLGTRLTGSGRIDPASEEEFFAVQLTAGRSARVSVERTSGNLDGWLGLFDPSGIEVAFDDDSGGDRNPQLTYRPVVTGRFRARVSSYQGRSTGDYNIAVCIEDSSAGGGPPPAPTGVTAQGVSSSEIRVSWSSVSSATSYRLEGHNCGPITSSTSYVCGGYSGSTAIYFRVYARNSYGESGPSAWASASPLAGGSPPSAPTGVTAQGISSSEIRVSWSSVTGATSYRLEGHNCGPITSSTSYVCGGYSGSTAILFRVYARNGYGESGPSGWASASPLAGGSPPSAPTGVTAQGISSSEIRVSWSSVSSATSYRLEGHNCGPITSSTSYVCGGYSGSTAIYFRVYARNGYGESGPSGWASASPLAGGSPPSAPTGVTAQGISASEIRVSWSSVSGATSYRLEGHNCGPIISSTSYVCGGYSGSTAIYFRVYARNGYGESGPSGWASASPLAGGSGSCAFQSLDVTGQAVTGGISVGSSQSYCISTDGSRWSGRWVSFRAVGTSSNLDTVLRLYRPDGSLAGENDDAIDYGRGSFLTALLSQAGIYRLEVRGYAQTSGNYRTHVTLNRMAHVADANANCTVDSGDEWLVSHFLGSTGDPDKSWINADINLDGMVNTLDMAYVLSAAGVRCP